ncbi:GGDEF domain-containing protein [Yoonia sp. 2307UL14-13]|uniref:GGDEF domain-containing protein n=1 Tax=Yoonia sp. 2307UL14-13 TaxID=3126506 RepID=UPI0030ADF60D
MLIFSVYSYGMQMKGYVRLMHRALQSWAGVVLAAALTTMAAVLVATALAYILYPSGALADAMFLTPIITITTAFPFCIFVWAQVRDKIRLSTKLQHLVNRDRLTNVATRDYFFRRMASRPKSDGIMLMVDIDHFKRVNDTYGHVAGDAVIRHVAQILVAQTRRDDIVCRFGGEEFMVFLRDQDLDDGFAVAERMRAEIATAMAKSGDTQIPVTVSIGGAIKEPDADVAVVISVADAALYQAKRDGRNRTHFADPRGIEAAPQQRAS